MKRNILTILVLSFLMVSCAKVLIPTKELPSHTKSIAIKDYSLYIFQLEKVIDTTLKSKKKLVVTYPKIKNITSKKDTLIYEELYLLIDKEETHCYYLSTFSHKYIFEDGIFNNRNYKNAFYLNDLDYIFYGDIKNSIIIFRNEAMIGPNTKEDIKIIFSKTSDSIEFVSITNDNPNKKERKKKDSVIISNVFSIDFTFIKSQRIMKYRNDYNVEGKLDSINFSCNDAYFKTDIPNYNYIKLKDRFKHLEFNQ